MVSKLEAFAVATAVVILGMTMPTITLPTKNNAGGSINWLIHLGDVDGKSYFYEPIGRNWTRAEKMCSESGMQLATITSQEQVEFLNNFKKIFGIFAYWVGAQEKRTLSRYAWKNNGEGINESLAPLHHAGFPPAAQCLTVWIPAYEINYFNYPCDILNFSLCEMNS